jgi:hypothetical protein
MNTIKMLALAGAAMTLSTSASAATLLVSFTPSNDSIVPFTFTVDDSPQLVEEGEYYFAAVISNATGEYVGLERVTFWNILSFGAFQDLIGPQLYIGLTSAPTILTGTFDVRSFSNANKSGIVTISAVPEPSTWAMMLVGFGMMGAAMRYRRRGTKVAYA